MVSDLHELFFFFRNHCIDTLDVLEAAATKWNFQHFKPGLVGGHCIGIDPYYLTYRAEQIGIYSELVLAGRRVNNGMSDHVVSILIKKMLEKKIKDSVPDIGIITDVALDPYTSHGHDGILSEDGEILNDKTVEILQEQSLSLARAGADILAPSDMMDGRIGKIRAILDKNGYENVNLLSYAAKYASTFYGPFRDAIGSGTSLGRSDKKTYQMDPRNSNEALWEVALDLEEGADMVMIKPGLPYLDILKRVKETYSVPTFAYQVSGEYLMLKNLYPEEPELEREVIVESLLCFKRAGADAIFSYFSERVAGWLKNPN